MTHSGYFRLATIVALVMGIKDRKLLFYRGFSEGRMDKNISMRDLNNRAVYDCLNNTFPDDCGIPALNLPHRTLDDIPLPHKISCYTPDLIPATISFASENSVSTLTTPSDSPKLLLLPSDDPNPPLP